MGREALEILEKIKNEGFDVALAFATEAEIQNGGACGQLSMIVQEDEE